MERTTNSALRLHRMLLALRGASREGRPIRQVLGEVFELPPDDDLALRRRLLAVDDLFVQSEAAMRSIPGIDLQRYLRHFPAARKALLGARLDQDSRRYAPFQEALGEAVCRWCRRGYRAPTSTFALVEEGAGTGSPCCLRPSR